MTTTNETRMKLNLMRRRLATVSATSRMRPEWEREIERLEWELAAARGVR